MIAKNNVLLRALIVWCLIITSSQLNARIKSVEIIYDKTEVYNGNTLLFRLKVTDHKNRVYPVRDAKNRYDMNRFYVFPSGNASINHVDDYGFWITVGNDQRSDSIKIRLELTANSLLNYNFTIPKVDYKSQIESISIMPVFGYLKNESHYSPQFETRLKNGEIIPVTSDGKIKSTYFDYRVISGGKLDENNSGIFIYDTNFCNPELQFEVWLKSDPSIRKRHTLPLKHIPRMNLDYSGNKDIPGKNGYNVEIKLSMVKLACTDDSLVKIELNSNKFREPQLRYLTPNKDILTVQSNGNDGRNGQNGYNGQNGGHGRTYILESCRENGYAQSGGNGGNGGNGTNGSNGGNGGDIIVFYEKDVRPYLDQLILKSYGGNWGRGGRGGQAGLGGQAGNGAIGTASNGVSGSPGYNGRDGTPGRNGTISYVEIE